MTSILQTFISIHAEACFNSLGVCGLAATKKSQFLIGGRGGEKKKERDKGLSFFVAASAIASNKHNSAMLLSATLEPSDGA